jgi:hypothetical protein
MALRQDIDDDDATKQRRTSTPPLPKVRRISTEDRADRSRRRFGVPRINRLSLAICLLAFTDSSRGFRSVSRSNGKALLGRGNDSSKIVVSHPSAAGGLFLRATRDHKETRPKDLASATDWDVSDSLGSLLENMKKSDEALSLSSSTASANGKKRSRTTGPEAEVEELVPIAKTKSKGGDVLPSITPTDTSSSSSSLLNTLSDLEVPSTMDKQTAKQLDAAVTPLRRGSFQRLVQDDLQVIPLSKMYTTATEPAVTDDAAGQRSSSSSSSNNNITTTKNTLPWSEPEHYLDRIDRDRRHLAVSIAASITDELQWKAFCQERGGLYPILQTIREGARAISRHHHHERRHQRRRYYEGKNSVLLRTDLLDAQREESFRAACSACRAIRDLCTISPDQAAVITDGILRANAAWSGNLMEDFRMILQYAKEYTAAAENAIAKRNPRFLLRFRSRRDTRLRCKLYVTQLLLELTIASDDAVAAIRSNPGLVASIVDCSSYATKEQTKRWIRYPAEVAKWLWRRTIRRRSSSSSSSNQQQQQRESTVAARPPFMEAARLSNDLLGQVQRCSNQILAAIGYNKWVPKIPGQKGLRVLALDGGGSRGMVTVKALQSLME